MPKHFLLADKLKFELKSGNQTLGRSSENQICIGEPSISSRHLLISNLNTYIEIMDLNSSNGTLVNNKKIPAFKPMRLTRGDKLTLGKLNAEYELKADEQEFKSNVHNIIPPPIKYGTGDLKSDVTVLAKFDPKEFSKAAEKNDIESNDLDKIQQNNKRLAFLYSFGQKIGSIFDIRDLFKQLLSDIFEIFSAADRALIFLRQDDGKMIPEIFFKNGKELSIEEATYSKTIVSMATNEKHGFIASDLGSGNDFDTSKSILMLNLQCTMIVPFIVDNEIYGLFQLDSTKKINAFNEEDLQMLSGICNQVAVNIKNKLLLNEMNMQAKVKNSLERYLGPKLVTHLIENKINLEQKGQEKLVSILFSDIRGFTPLSERLKPSQVIEILSIYFSKMTEIIFKYDGFIDKFIGDAVFCIFGIPIYMDNHADLAVQSAIEMQKALKVMNEEIFKPMSIELNVGIGINTGNVVYGNIASMDRPEVTILGDSVNVSERLCSLAKGGQILISQECLNYLNSTYEMEKMGFLKLKGKEEKVLVYSVGV